MSLLDSPLLLEHNDILQPIGHGASSITSCGQRIIKKARRRRSIAVIKGLILNHLIEIKINFLSEFDETPTKQFNGLKDMLTLTPETDDDCGKHKDTKKETQMVSRPLTDQVSCLIRSGCFYTFDPRPSG